MKVHRRSLPSRLATLSLLVIASLIGTSVSRAQDSHAVFELVKPSVAQVNIGQSSLGSGCVVDAEKGIIVTNYHVVEEAKGEKVTVTFYADKDKKRYPVAGFLAIVPTKDLALIQIDPSLRKLKALKIAAEQPAPGDKVHAFGSPLGLPLSPTEGIVAAVRTGEELKPIIKFNGGDYEHGMGYDLEANWIQHSAQISHGNSGGPLTNSKGELLGLNTWNLTAGQNLNFAISAVHIKKILDKGDLKVKSFNDLPPPRHSHGPRGERGPGDSDKTYAVWKAFNQAEAEFNKKVAEVDKKKAQVPPMNNRNPLQGAAVRNKKLAAVYKLYSKAYTDFAGKVKGLRTGADVNDELVKWLVIEGDTLHRLGDAYQELAQITGSQAEPMGDADLLLLVGAKQSLNDQRTRGDVLRITLGRIFGREFPTVDETEREMAGSGSDASASEKPAASPGGRKSTNETAKRFELRTWTSHDGNYHIRAKLRSVDDDKIKLEKEDGAVIVVPISKLSDADQRFIDETSS
ncbi:MAG: trypsin-like peptidase domain-containing protein [Thermoguttaceae bacterium]